MWICPICGSREIGKISRGRYFCRECCNEWTAENGEIAVYQIAVDGSVARLRSKVTGKGPYISPELNVCYLKRQVS